MPKVTQEKTNARKEEIVNACAKLYETTSFKDMTLKDIGKATSFTRTSIYNYFQTKEEIFLALLQREYDLWNEDLTGILEKTKVSPQMSLPIKSRSRSQRGNGCLNLCR